MPEVSAVVLAGGKSQRLGIDKALLTLEGEWLLERVTRTLAPLTDDLLIAGGKKPEYTRLPARVVPDIWAGAGPLGGILAGLSAMRHERGLFVACDMPFLVQPLLRFMISLSTDYDVVIPRIGQNVEPLHALYSKKCIRPIDELIRRGERRVIHIFHEVSVRFVVEAEIDAYDREHLSFFNINTTADLALAQQLLHRAVLSFSTPEPSSGKNDEKAL